MILLPRLVRRPKAMFGCDAVGNMTLFLQDQPIAGPRESWVRSLTIVGPPTLTSLLPTS